MGCPVRRAFWAKRWCGAELNANCLPRVVILVTSAATAFRELRKTKHLSPCRYTKRGGFYIQASIRPYRAKERPARAGPDCGQGAAAFEARSVPSPSQLTCRTY